MTSEALKVTSPSVCLSVHSAVYPSLRLSAFFSARMPGRCLYVCMTVQGLVCLSVSMSVRLSAPVVCLSVYLHFRLRLCLYTCIPVCPFVCPSVRSAVRRSVCLPSFLSARIYLSVCLYACPFRLFVCLPDCPSVRLSCFSRFSFFVFFFFFGGRGICLFACPPASLCGFVGQKKKKTNKKNPVAYLITCSLDCCTV